MPLRLTVRICPFGRMCADPPPFRATCRPGGVRLAARFPPALPGRPLLPPGRFAFALPERLLFAPPGRFAFAFPGRLLFAPPGRFAFAFTERFLFVPRRRFLL